MSLSGLFSVRTQSPAYQARPSVSRNAPNVTERRRESRHDVDYPVMIRQQGGAPVRGYMINMSLSGAAIEVNRWATHASGNWTSQLRSGDEIWISGLLTEPVFCWVVEAKDHVLRVHYFADAAMRTELRAMTVAN